MVLPGCQYQKNVIKCNRQLLTKSLLILILSINLDIQFGDWAIKIQHWWKGQRLLNFQTFALASIRYLCHAQQRWWSNQSQLINDKKWAAETGPCGSGSQLPVSLSGTWRGKKWKKKAVHVFLPNSYDYIVNPFWNCVFKKKKKVYMSLLVALRKVEKVEPVSTMKHLCNTECLYWGDNWELYQKIYIYKDFKTWQLLTWLL